MIKGGFNSGFIEVRTLEGDKFIKDLKIGDPLLTPFGYAKLTAISKRTAKPNESVYNIYYHDDDKEGILDRISGDQLVPMVSEFDLIINKEVSSLKEGMKLVARKSVVVIDRIEKMETVNRFFYNIYTEQGYYADNIYITD